MRIGERLCRCTNSGTSRNLRHATPSARELAAKQCLSGSPRRLLDDMVEQAIALLTKFVPAKLN